MYTGGYTSTFFWILEQPKVDGQLDWLQCGLKIRNMCLNLRKKRLMLLFLIIGCLNLFLLDGGHIQTFQLKFVLFKFVLSGRQFRLVTWLHPIGPELECQGNRIGECMNHDISTKQYGVWKDSRPRDRQMNEARYPHICDQKVIRNTFENWMVLKMGIPQLLQN